MTTHDFKITTTFPTARIADLLVCAREGGSGYWCAAWEHHFPETPTEPDPAVVEAVCGLDCYLAPFVGGWISVREDDGTEHRLDAAGFQRALAILSEKYPRHLHDALDDGRFDATTGDVFIQCAIFGDIVYG